IEGMPLGKAYRLSAGPGPGMPYLNTNESPIELPGSAPIISDIELEHGVAIRGRLIDKATGKPVRGTVSYMPTGDNPRLAELNYNSSRFLRQRPATGTDGEFEVVGLPGRGLLIASASDAGRFTTAEPEAFAESAESLKSAFANAVATLDIPGGIDSFSRDVTLDPGRTLSGTVLDPDGRPLAGTIAFGLGSMIDNNSSRTLDTASFTVTALKPGHERFVVIQHPGRRLGTSVMLRGDETEAVAVKLVPCASIAGRLVDARGNPRPKFVVTARSTERNPSRMLLGITPTWPSATTDDEGRFRIEGLVADMFYNVSAYSRTSRDYEVLVEEFKPRPGQTRDLGDVHGSPE
ncbi:carboxypeptidase-like regulatory domain-containing protein, partial [Singulisphaera rosea]